MSKRLIILILFCAQFTVLFAQSGIIFKADQNFSQKNFEAHLSELTRDRLPLDFKVKIIFRELDLFSLEIGTKDISFLMKELEAYPGILWLTEDQELQNRFIPDDTFFNDQWYLEQIKAIESWNIAKGGLSPNGDTIVLAILDDGFYTSHEDLIENLYRNYADIPGDGKDNDNNGYTDDHLGLNASTGNDMHSVREHGTAVAGIAGASGNNGKGVSGVSIDVQLLLISEANTLGNVIESYQYILDLREKYNDTNGQEGAFIVATNLSAGINGVFPEDNPLYQQWCAIYDVLGAQGILSVNATTNSDSNIDIDGDMPGTCSSDFLIIVTNSNQNDNKVKDAGYGTTSVDLGAPGVEILTTALSNEYANFSGASSSSPQVTGALGLLYNAPCEVFANQVKDNPSGSALRIKEMILGGVDQSPDLSDKVRSGGRLNILNALASLRDYCEGTTGELEIINTWPNPAKDRVNIHFETEHFELHTFKLFNSVGQLVYIEEFNPDFFGDKIFELELNKIFLPTGVYIATIKNDKGISSSKILIRN